MTTELALVPVLHRGETFPSWVTRLAALNDNSLKWALVRLGLSSGRPREKPAGYGLYLTDQQRAHIQTITGVPDDDLRGSLMTSWVGGPAGGTTRTGEDATTNGRKFNRHNWVYTSGSHYCPACLKQTNGVWLLDWKLPWVFACPQHATLLRHECPTCRHRPPYENLDGSLFPTFPMSVAEPGCCANKNGVVGRSGKRGRCSTDLREVPAGLALPPALLEIQVEVINAQPTQSRQWWNDLKVLSKLALGQLPAAGLQEVLPAPVPAELVAAWDVAMRRRDGLDPPPTVHPDTPKHQQRTLTWNSLANTPPTDPALLAIATAIALNALRDQSALNSLIDLTYRGSTRKHPRAVVEYSGSELLNQRVARAVTSTSRFKLPDHGNQPPQKETLRWKPANLPPLLWEDIYDTTLAPLTVGFPISRWALRRFAVICLYKLATEASWTAAAAHFSMNKRDNLPFQLRSKIAAASGRASLTALMDAIDTLAVRLNDERRLAQYPAIRAAATARFSEPVPAEVYAASTPSNFTSHFVTETRLKYAAIYAWTWLTSDEPKNAPWWPSTPSKGQIGHYWAWLRDSPPELRRALACWAQTQVNDRITMTASR